MGRPANPTPAWDEDRKIWTVRITLPKPAGWPAGREAPRKLYDLPEIPEDQEERAKAVAKIVSDRVRRGEAPPAPGESETCTMFFARWNASRTAAGLRTEVNDKSRWSKWIAPHLGPKPIVAVTSRDVEHFVHAMDRDVRAGKLSWRTATRIWSVVGKLFDDARRSKDLALRVRQDNPVLGVRGPDRGDEKASAFLFPSEMWTLLSCEAVPLSRRRIYALAVYLGLRMGELKALGWEDVHEGEGFVLVHRSEDARTGETKSTKSGKVRRVPIEPALLPLLEAMREEDGGEHAKGAVVDMSATNWPMLLRADLAQAHASPLRLRADITADDATRRPLDFHDLRHTYGTLRAIRGDAVVKISRAMGHADLATTSKYINVAEAFGGASFGVPLGPLPPAIVSGGESGVSGGSGGRPRASSFGSVSAFRRPDPLKTSTISGLGRSTRPTRRPRRARRRRSNARRSSSASRRPPAITSGCARRPARAWRTGAGSFP